ncbi:MAG TPA: hypothetical protein PK728_11300, partial [Bacillota bacterium]|nr:hypothetical protein [Bacillota bacterium]
MGFKRIDRGRKEKKAGKWLFLLAGLIIPLIISFNELDLKKAFKSKEPAVVPAVLEEKKEDPADSLAAAEKIAGYANPEALISVYELNRIIFEPDTF